MEGKLDLSFRGEILESAEGAHGEAWVVFEPRGEPKKVWIKHPELGAKDIRIKVMYSGICQSDLHCINDILKGYTVFPIIAGHEIIGRVYSVGSQVTDLVEGDIVGVGPIRDCCERCDFCRVGEDNLCKGVQFKMTISPWFGGFATSVQVPSTYAFKIPKGIKPELAPPLMCAGGTVYAPLRKYGKIGGKVAILGIGGLGHLAVQFARQMGMKTYAVSSSEARRELTLKLGADVYINSSDTEQMKAFQGEKVDLIINTTGVGDVSNYMKALRPGTGVFVQIGAPESEFKINPYDVILSELTLTGIAAANREDMNNMLQFSERNNVVPMNEIYNFADFPKALERQEKGKPNFRVVLDVESYNSK